MQAGAETRAWKTQEETAGAENAGCIMEGQIWCYSLTNQVSYKSAVVKDVFLYLLC